MLFGCWEIVQLESDRDDIVFSTWATEHFHIVEKKAAWKLCRLTVVYGKET